jgi:predicted nucleotidyltransferase
MITTAQDLDDMLVAHSRELRQRGVGALAVFGSFARSEQRSDSDIDLLVDFAPGMKSFERFIDLAFYLEELLGRRVDLVTREGLSPHVGPHILRELHHVDLVA